MKKITIFASLLTFASSIALADLKTDEHPDASYFGVIRSVWRIQDSEGKITNDKYGLLSYIFARKNGTVSDVYLTAPGQGLSNFPNVSAGIPLFRVDPR